MSDPLAWVARVATLVSDPATSVAALARWAGAEGAGEGDEVTIARPPAMPGAIDVVVSGSAGRPEAVSAAYPPAEGPALADAERVLGAWHEFDRPPEGPFQGAFWGTAPRGWEVVGTLRDPPGAGGRRLVEVALIRG